MHERGALLNRASLLLDYHADTWGHELASEEGKTKAEGIAEVRRAAQILRYHGQEGERTLGDLYSSPRHGERILVTRRPVGVIGVISPFNFPVAIPAWKIAPALVHGNAVVWKPAPTVPLLAMRLAQALNDAGLPPGVLNLLHGDSDVGDAIVNHRGIDAVTFTGSTAVGRNVAAACAARGIAVQAEMGGINAAIVLEDADIDLAVEEVLRGAFLSSGQKCTATSRLIVTDAVADVVLGRLCARADALVVGDPVDDATDMGPVISDEARNRIRSTLALGLRDGGRVLAGARDVSGDAGGYFVSPTILEEAGEASLWTEEVFGPVITVCRARNDEGAISMANGSRFGLSAAVFTENLYHVLQVVDDLAVGVLHINSETAGADPHVPFGGVKHSALGPKEQGQAARDFFTQSTTVYLRSGASVRQSQTGSSLRSPLRQPLVDEVDRPGV